MAWIDLTIAFDDTVAGFAAVPAKSIATDGWNATTLSLYSHAGTHMDAPCHFGVNDRGIDSYDIQRFMGKAWVLEVAIAKPSQLITLADIAPISDAFAPGDGLLIKTGWQEKRGTAAYRDHLPRINEELAQWLVSRQANMLLVEPPSVADVNNLEEVTRIHQILLSGDIIIIEGIQTVGLSCSRADIIALPLHWRGGDGAPVRVLAKPVDQ